jgi:glycosyltransferase involved in cell wall biosynthesis
MKRRAIEAGAFEYGARAVRMPHNAIPPVSVVVPVWDSYAGAFLDEALASVLAEGPTAELIVVDNASDTPVAPKDDRVIVVRTPMRLTCGAARNFGLRAVRAPLVVMWDADDVMVPGTLRHLRERLAADHRLVAQATAIVESPAGPRHRWPRRWVSVLTRWPRLLALVNSIWSQYPTTGATMMRTDVVRHAGGYGEAESGDDWSLGVALLWRGRVGWSERPGRHYRRHTLSLWRRCSTTQHLLDHARVVRAGLRRDPAVPRWCRAAMPLIQLGQYAAILVVKPIYEVLRRLDRRP